METIIIRKKQMPVGVVASNYINITNGRSYKNSGTLIKKFGIKYLMKELYNEGIDSNTLQDTALYKEYQNLCASPDNLNDEFAKIYLINESFGLFISQNIFLFHLIPKVGKSKIKRVV